MRQEPAGETGQLSLLHGFVSPSRSLGTQPAAPQLPIARVLLDSPLPHLDRVFDYFPRLKERRKQIAGTLSGGEQQMLAMSRALMSHPKLMMLDEPSMGLAPILVDQIFEIIKELHASGTTILLVEQNATKALQIADRAYVLENGKITLSGTGAELASSDEVRKAYLGG